MNISKYFCLILILINSMLLQANEVEDTLFRWSARVGFDLSGPARLYLEPEVQSWEMVADIEWRANWYAVVEAGFMGIDVERPRHQYQASGSFFRVGINHNLMQKYDSKEIGIGYALFRYGVGTLQHNAPGISIESPYWGDYETAVDTEPLYAHWLEIGGGLTTKLIGRVYAGWSLRTRLLLKRTENTAMDPYYISGFGRNQDQMPVMIHFHILYRFN